MEKTNYDIDELEKRAFRAYFRRFGTDAPIPSSSVDWHGSVLCLNNVNGCLAHYRVGANGKLRFDENGTQGEMEGGQI